MPAAPAPCTITARAPAAVRAWVAHSTTSVKTFAAPGGLVAVVDLMGQHQDRGAVVVVTLPAFGKLEGPSSGDHRPCRHELAEHLPIGSWTQPVIEPREPPPSVATRFLAFTVVWSGDQAVD
jgi:hypothetical protein